jgi:hypothetical protein
MQSAVESGRPPSACRGGRSNEIEAASRVRQECARPDGTRRFIRGASRGSKVRGLTGIHRRPGRRCRMRGNPKTGKTAQLDDKRIRGNPKLHLWHRRRMRDSGKLEYPSVGAAGGLNVGATRRFTAGTAGRCGTGGNSGNASQSCTGRSMIQRLARHSRKRRRLQSPAFSSYSALFYRSAP